MIYTLRGQFCGALAPDFTEPLADITVRFYKYRGGKYISSLAVAEPEATMALLSAEAVSAKAASLLGEVTTDVQGNFGLTLEEATYKGEAFDIDLVFHTVPGRKTPMPHLPLQIALTTMKPRWETVDGAYQAHWEYCLSPDLWHAVRAHFDAWLIAGYVTVQGTDQPLNNVQVTAFDADWWQDDQLGSALTDAAGKFRIDYERADFTRTPLSPLLNQEEEGPDLYFTVCTPDGGSLLNEPKTQGYLPGRKNVNHCAFVKLAVAVAPVPA